MLTLGLKVSRFPLFMSPPCQFYNNGFMYINLNYIIITLKSFITVKYTQKPRIFASLLNKSWIKVLGYYLVKVKVAHQLIETNTTEFGKNLI